MRLPASSGKQDGKIAEGLAWRVRLDMAEGRVGRPRKRRSPVLFRAYSVLFRAYSVLFRKCGQKSEGTPFSSSALSLRLAGAYCAGVQNYGHWGRSALRRDGRF